MIMAKTGGPKTVKTFFLSREDKMTVRTITGFKAENH
jgi:hypothetical protein